MKILIAVSVIVALLMFSKVRVVSDAVLNNFNLELKLKIKILSLFRINLNLPGKAKKQKNEKNEKNEKKVTLNDIKGKKSGVFKAVSLICGILKKSVKIDYLETDVTVALEDPMNTGLAYAAVMASANVFYKSVRIKQPFLDVRYDFESGEGLKIKHKSEIYIRPISVLTALVQFKIQS